MPVDAIPNCGSQIDRAICAYLIGGGCGDATNVSPSYSTGNSKYPNIKVKAFQMQDDVSASGNEIWQVQIQVKASAATEKGDSNPDGNRVSFDGLCGLVWALMQQADDQGRTFRPTASAITSCGRALKTAPSTTPKTWASPENNSDMDEFTCKDVFRKNGQRGEPDEQGAAWVEVRTYEVHAVPANVD